MADISITKKPHTNWTIARTKLFLEHLSQHCNVSAALAHSGMASSSLYRQRRDNSAFRKAWDQALDQGYARLEAILLDRALNGEQQEVLDQQGTKVSLRKISNTLGLALLKMHAVRVAAIRAMHGTDHDEHAMEAKIAIIKKLDQLARHTAKKEEERLAGRGGT